MMTTVEMLKKKYGFLLTTKDLCELLHFASTKALLNTISAGAFPIPTFKRGRHRVADVRDVARYLDELREEARVAHEADAWLRA